MFSWHSKQLWCLKVWWIVSKIRVVGKVMKKGPKQRWNKTYMYLFGQRSKWSCWNSVRFWPKHFTNVSLRPQETGSICEKRAKHFYLNVELFLLNICILFYLKSLILTISWNVSTPPLNLFFYFVLFLWFPLCSHKYVDNLLVVFPSMQQLFFSVGSCSSSYRVDGKLQSEVTSLSAAEETGSFVCY